MSLLRVEVSMVLIAVELGVVIVLMGIFIFFVYRSMARTGSDRLAILIEDAGARKRAQELERRLLELEGQISITGGMGGTGGKGGGPSGTGGAGGAGGSAGQPGEPGEPGERTLSRRNGE